MRRVIIVMLTCAVWARVDGASAQARPAQPPTAGSGEVRGSVVDAETKQPLAAASVELWSHVTGALVAGAITRSDGMFRIDGLQPGVYSLRTAMLGYEAYRMAELTVHAATPRITLPPIEMGKSPILLQQLEVRAESPVIIAPDRSSYRAQDVAPAAASATDVLEQVPAVRIDADGKVSLRGNENVVVQINGRPTPLSGLQLASYLRQLPAGTIDRIEVVPNPSARQDPEGMAGIVNIVMKQSVDLGRSAGLTLAGASSGRYSASGNFGYQGGPLTMLTTYGFYTDDRRVTGINDRTRLGDGRTPLSSTEQDIDGQNASEGHNAGLNVDYRLNARDVVYLASLFNTRTGSDASLTEYTERDGWQELLDRYDRTRDNSNRNRLADVSVGFRRTIAPQRHELSAELRGNDRAERDRTALWLLPDVAGGAATGPAPREGEASELRADSRQLIAQADYTRPLGQGGRLETGFRSDWRWMDRDYRVSHDRDGTGEWTPGAGTNALEFDQAIHAAYAVVSRSAGRLDLQGGLRAEYARRDFTVRGGERHPYDYTSLFPSAAVALKLGGDAQARFSYSRRVRRPGTQELNPFPTFFDAQNVFFGNPELGPEYTDAVELSLQRPGRTVSLQAAPFYRYTRDVIRVDINTADTLGGREVTSISFRNLASSQSYGADLSAQLRAGRLSGMAGANVFRVVTDGGSESLLSSDALTWTGRVNTTWAALEGTTLQASYYYQAPMNVERGRFAGHSALGLSIRQKLPTDNLFLTVRGSDILDTQRMRIQLDDDSMIQLTSRSFASRALHVSLQYNIGQAPRVRQRQDEEGQGPGFPRM